jgi:Meckel syndrome type 1 protein
MSGGNEQFEREFEEFLNEEDSKLLALYRKLPRPEPDAKLDAAVAAMARRAVASSPPPRARAPRWIPALSAAAIVALAAGIAFRMGPQVWQQRNAPLPQAENAMSAGAAAKEHDADDALKDKAAPKPVPAEPMPRSAPASASAPAPAAPPASTVAKTTAPAVLHKAGSAAKRIDAPTPQAFPLQAEQEKKSEQPGGAQAQGGIAGQAFERHRDQREQAAPAPMAAPAREEPAPPPPPAPMVAPATETSAVNGAAADSALAAPSPPAAKAARTAPLRSKDPNARLYPEHWLQNIRMMLGEGNRDDALRSLAEFRKMYPDYHLPDDLRDLK